MCTENKGYVGCFVVGRLSLLPAALSSSSRGLTAIHAAQPILRRDVAEISRVKIPVCLQAVCDSSPVSRLTPHVNPSAPGTVAFGGVVASGSKGKRAAGSLNVNPAMTGCQHFRKSTPPDQSHHASVTTSKRKNSPPWPLAPSPSAPSCWQTQ